ncbi:MAG: hypothetical protein IPN29_07670 [Saprospiraceae bacterium]|nr:hypothetical protein [Saprospiraceae bacterium]
MCIYFTMGIAAPMSFAQLFSIDADSFSSSRMSLAEFSFGKKLDNDYVAGHKRYYDFGISIDLFCKKINNKLHIGLSPFADIHVVDNKGYEKFGLRGYFEIIASPETSYKLAMGPVIHSTNLSRNTSAGISVDLSYYPTRAIGIFSRFDRLTTRQQLQNAHIADITLGIKIRPKGLISILGYLFGVGSIGFNGILRSQ